MTDDELEELRAQRVDSAEAYDAALESGVSGAKLEKMRVAHDALVKKLYWEEWRRAQPDAVFGSDGRTWIGGPEPTTFEEEVN